MTSEEEQEVETLYAQAEDPSPEALEVEEPRKPYDEEGYLEVIEKGEDASTHQE
ncbi:hypothetical protein [Anaerotardibacter muris]|uniref:hypothetical protein n=1 Tax=Anaerotardibacter muris TaxID=2941505 RepID=UPI00203F0A59|nr:hypothetical protein [Anaerotardibacter muris]